MNGTMTLPFPLKDGNTVLDSNENFLFLCQELNRKGETMYVVRLVLGDRAPVLYAPFLTEEKGREAFLKASDRAGDLLIDLECEIGGILGIDTSFEY